jgi:hypothetical protein
MRAPGVLLRKGSQVSAAVWQFEMSRKADYFVAKFRIIQSQPDVACAGGTAGETG